MSYPELCLFYGRHILSLVPVLVVTVLIVSSKKQQLLDLLDLIAEKTKRLLKRAHEMRAGEDWQDALDSLRFSGRITRFKWNARQCVDVADCLDAVVTASRRQFAGDKQRWRRICTMCKPAASEFCRVIVDAKMFLQDCSLQADFWQSVNSIVKLDTREAYDVILHSLIWSKAALSVAILYSEAADGDYTQIIMKQVHECTSLLSDYDRMATQPRLNEDREELYHSAANPQKHLHLHLDEAQKKYLTFLVGKSQAHRELSREMYGSGGSGTQKLQLEKFWIDPCDLVEDSKENFLGFGSFGFVYRYSCHGRPVAVKVFKGLNPQDHWLFEKEASVLASLRSPFIVEMVGWCRKGDDCMLVTALADTDLEKVIDESRQTLSMHAALDIMLQIARGMEYLHKRRLIHRDLKPSNVLLEPCSVKETAAQGRARVKLCDFGLAKVKQARAEDPNRYTTPKQGTTYYRAPEVLLEEDKAPAKYTRKADVFSYGVTCSELLGGTSATSCYRNGTAKEVQMRIRQNVRPSLPPDCPSHLKDLITKCWDADPECRPPFSRISSTLTYLKFIMMRVSDVRLYGSVVSPFDVDELERRGSRDEGSTVDGAVEDVDDED